MKTPKFKIGQRIKLTKRISERYGKYIRDCTKLVIDDVRRHIFSEDRFVYDIICDDGKRYVTIDECDIVPLDEDKKEN